MAEIFSDDVGYGTMTPNDDDEGVGVDKLVDDAIGSVNEDIVGRGIGAPEP
jgi:hypothetical protein